MKTETQRFLTPGLIALAIGLLGGTSIAQVNTNQINWGSLDASTIVDSNGAVLEAANFTFELGAFVEGFTPTESNVEAWFDNWRTFDRAVYNEAGGVFAGQYTMYDDSLDSRIGSDFEGLGISRDAFVWVYNSTIPEPGTEWFLARANNWQFPEVADGCCNNDLPLEWSMSDLSESNIPLWGNQLGQEGSGERENFVVTADLQTYTFIPEPSVALLMVLAGIAGVMRRTRPKA